MAAPSISTYILSSSSHYYGSEGGAAVMTSPSDSVTKVSAIISQTSGGTAIETVDTTVKTSSDLFADRWALTWHTAGITASPYYVRMWATNSDGDGTVREVAPYIYFPPSVSVTSPVDGSTLTDSSVTMAWTATDDYGISYQRVSVSHDGAELWGAEVEGSSIAVPSSVVFENGESYSFSVMARNGKGMESTATNTASFSFVAPSAPALVIAEGDGKSATITVDDPHYSESGATIAVDGSAIADEFTVFGASVQDGTPTPSTPVAINSVGADGYANVNAVGKNLIVDELTGVFVNGATGAVSAAAGAQTVVAAVPRNTNCVLTYDGGNRCIIVGFTKPDIQIGDVGTPIYSTASKNSPKTFNSGNFPYIACYVATSAAPASNIQVEVGSIASAFEAYGEYIHIDLSGNALRSLPDGTRDELRVGERVTLVKRVGHIADVSARTLSYSGGSIPYAYFPLTAGEKGAPTSGSPARNNCMSTVAPPKVPLADPCCYVTNDGLTVVIGSTAFTSLATATTMLTGAEFDYALATPQEIDLGAASDHPFIPEDGEMWVDGTEMEASLRPADYAGQPMYDSVDVIRVNADGSTWTVASNLTTGDTVTDPLPPLGVDAVYKAVGKTSAGGISEKLDMHEIPTTGWVLNFGDAAQETVGFIYNPQATMTLAQGGESYHFADGGMGGGLPVFYPTTDRDASGTLAFDTVLYGDSDRLLDLCRRYPVAWLRDPFGHRWRAHVRPSVSHGVGQVWPVTIAWDAVRFEEV